MPPVRERLRAGKAEEGAEIITTCKARRGGRGSLFFLALVLFTAAAVPLLAHAAGDGPTPRFEPAPCTFAGAEQFAGDAIEFGYLVVPERHANPDGPTVKLGVAILKRAADGAPAGAAEEDGAQPAPLVMAQGGPGGSTIDAFLSLFSSGELAPLLEDRDVVLFDQRGTLYSEPALMCPESITLTEETIEQDLTRQEDLRRSLEALQKCRDRLAAGGVDLAAFNSLENAADIAALRTALGYDQINLYGVSYGTLLALHALRLYPDGLRSIILDGVAPPQINFLTEAPRAHGRSFAELFRACAADPACHAAYPDLERATFDLVDRLNANPARVPITDGETGAEYDAVLDGDAFLDLLVQFFYVTPLIPLMPAVIDGAAEGNFTVMQRVWPVLAFDRTQAEGMYFSTVCAEDADFTFADVDLSGLQPQIADLEKFSAEGVLEACRDWDVPALGPDVDGAVSSAAPVLVFNGQYDPITPPAYGEAAAQSLAGSYLFTFPGLGHGALPEGACPVEIARAFLNDPATRPDASCLDLSQPAGFVTPANTLMTPVLGRILAAVERGDYLRFLPLVFGLGFLGTIFVLWPLSWFIRRMQKQPPERRLAARLAPWAAIAVVLVAGVFMAGLVALVFDVSLRGSDIVLLLGAPMRWAWLFSLPWAIGVLAACMLVLTIVAWRRPFWGAGRRVYYTLLAAAALAVSVSLLALFL
jgi:pimeloyl-ACP methyl ester carboxylesterase